MTTVQRESLVVFRLQRPVLIGSAIALALCLLGAASALRERSVPRRIDYRVRADEFDKVLSALRTALPESPKMARPDQPNSSAPQRSARPARVFMTAAARGSSASARRRLHP